MLKKRLIACLMIRDGLIVQSVNFERYLPIGRPKFSIEFVNKWDVDEIVLLDMDASREDRLFNLELLKHSSRYCFVPLTVGGGIKSTANVQRIIRAGADKVSLNTHALSDPTLISQIADTFGSQCIVVSMDCRKTAEGGFRVFTDSGKTDSTRDAVEWAQEVESLGAGEIFLNSIDRDGTKQGYDLDLISTVSKAVSIPVIACGGVGRFSDFAPGINAGASAVAAANIFHFVEHSTILAKAHLLDAGVDIRLASAAKYDGREFDEDGRLLMRSSEQLSEIELANRQRDEI